MIWQNEIQAYRLNQQHSGVPANKQRGVCVCVCVCHLGLKMGGKSQPTCRLVLSHAEPTTESPG